MYLYAHTDMYKCAGVSAPCIPGNRFEQAARKYKLRQTRKLSEFLTCSPTLTRSKARHNIGHLGSILKHALNTGKRRSGGWEGHSRYGRGQMHTVLTGSKPCLFGSSNKHCSRGDWRRPGRDQEDSKRKAGGKQTTSVSINPEGE